ncbi:MAG: hypothetical protein OXF22_07140 [Anaerolineaceae bacterium]|nr:hypothetical protein [Anaerolineaceae bacterium]
MTSSRRAGRRRAIFLTLALLLAAVAILGFSVSLLLSALRAGERQQAWARLPGASLREFATLPDDDAYPAALAIAADGTLYSGSFASGAIWRIDASGRAHEIPGTRATLYSVSGLTIAPDGTLYILDGAIGAGQGSADPAIYTLSPSGTLAADALTRIARVTDGQLPDDIAVDAAGNVYVSDWGIDVVWRFPPGAEGEIWWRAPVSAASDPIDPIGLAVDSSRDTLLVSDPLGGRVFLLPLAAEDPVPQTAILYDHGDAPAAPGFDGLTVTAEGAIYLAALGQNQLLRLSEGELIVIAEGFRGISDVVHHAGRLYATNWDQVSLVSQIVPAHIPFAIDVIELPAED